MKLNILITDILIKDFIPVYKKDFDVDCLWQLRNKIEFSKYEAIVVTGGFKTDRKFLKNFNPKRVPVDPLVRPFPLNVVAPEVGGFI